MPAQQVNRIPLPQIGADTAESWGQILPSGAFDLNDRRGPRVVWDMAAVIERSRNVGPIILASFGSRRPRRRAIFTKRVHFFLPRGR